MSSRSHDSGCDARPLLPSLPISDSGKPRSTGFTRCESKAAAMGSQNFTVGYKKRCRSMLISALIYLAYLRRRTPPILTVELDSDVPNFRVLAIFVFLFFGHFPRVYESSFFRLILLVIVA